MPVMPWESLESRLQSDFHAAGRRGEGLNFTIIGPKGTGKTHIALTIAEMCPYVLVLALKRTDPLVSQLEQEGYHITGELRSIQWATSDQARREVPVNNRVVFWPRFGEKVSPADRLNQQARLMSDAMDWADKTGGWAVVIDETMWMQDRLKLQAEMDSLWFQGRTQGLSVIANAQRPSRVPRLAFSQADYLFISKFSDQRDIETLRDISSNIPRETMEAGILQLDKAAHQFLFVDTARDHLAVVVAPPR